MIPLIFGGLWAVVAGQLAAGVKPLGLGLRLPFEARRLRMAGRAGPRQRSTFRRRVAWAATGSAALLVLVPPLAPAPVLGFVVYVRLLERRRNRRRRADVIDQLPDLVDLLRLTTSAGLPVAGAIQAIGDRPGGVVGAALGRSATLIERGASSTQALSELATACGGTVQSLVDALADHDRYGAALGPALDRVSLEARLQRRRCAEEAARQLPVTLLFPLVLTTLPAFVLLTIVPLLLGSFASLRF